MTRLTPAAMAALSRFSAPRTLVRTASMGKNSHEGTCLSAAAWNTKSTPAIASFRLCSLRTSPMWNLMRGSAQRRRMSSCFFSSREKTRISEMSVWR